MKQIILRHEIPEQDTRRIAEREASFSRDRPKSDDDSCRIRSVANASCNPLHESTTFGQNDRRGQHRDIQSTVLNLQRTIGNQAVQRMLCQNCDEPQGGVNATSAPARLPHIVGHVPQQVTADAATRRQLSRHPASDPAERQADRVAEHFARQPQGMQDAHRQCLGIAKDALAQGHSNPSRQNAALQRRFLDRSGPSGSPMREQVRELCESRMGVDFGAVRIHTDLKADRMSKRLSARAFTYGRDIYFAAGQYQPDTTIGKRILAHELTHIVQQNAGAPRIQRWALPTDWLDYIGLGVDVVERVYIELAYEEGEEKDFQRFINTLFFAIDLILAALPGVGGGGLALRGSRRLAIAGWGAIPDSAKLQIAEEVARQMGWTVVRATQMINAFFRSRDSDERRSVSSHESAGGHTGERHVGRSENWLRQRLRNEPNLEHASSFRNESAANRTQGRFTRRFREQIQTWLRGNQARFVRDIDMGQPIGIVLERGSSCANQTSRARVVLVRDNSTLGWHFLTSFPIP